MLFFPEKISQVNQNKIGKFIINLFYSGPEYYANGNIVKYSILGNTANFLSA